MTIEKRADIAANLKATGQCNCTQSVLKVFEDKINIAPEELSKLSAGFAAGISLLPYIHSASTQYASSYTH